MMASRDDTVVAEAEEALTFDALIMHVDRESLRFITSISAEDISLAAKDDSLDVYACFTNQKLGRFDISIDLVSTTEHGQVVVVTADCNGKIEGLDCGTLLKTRILIPSLATIEQSHEEYLKVDDGIHFSKNSYINLINNEYHVHVDTTTVESPEPDESANANETNTKTFDKVYQRDSLPAFLSEGALILMQKLMITKKGDVDRVNCIGLDGDGKLCPIHLKLPNQFEPNTHDLFGDSVKVVALEKVVQITGVREETWNFLYFESGHLFSWEHLSSPIFMKVSAVPDGAVEIEAIENYADKALTEDSNDDEDDVEFVDEDQSNDPVVTETEPENERQLTERSDVSSLFGFGGLGPFDSIDETSRILFDESKEDVADKEENEEDIGQLTTSDAVIVSSRSNVSSTYGLTDLFADTTNTAYEVVSTHVGDADEEAEVVAVNDETEVNDAIDSSNDNDVAPDHGVTQESFLETANMFRFAQRPRNEDGPAVTAIAVHTEEALFDESLNDVADKAESADGVSSRSNISSTYGLNGLLADITNTDLNDDPILASDADDEASESVVHDASEIDAIESLADNDLAQARDTPEIAPQLINAEEASSKGSIRAEMENMLCVKGIQDLSSADRSLIAVPYADQSLDMIYDVSLTTNILKMRPANTDSHIKVASGDIYAFATSSEPSDSITIVPTVKEIQADASLISELQHVSLSADETSTEDLTEGNQPDADQEIFRVESTEKPELTKGAYFTSLRLKLGLGPDLSDLKADTTAKPSTKKVKPPRKKPEPSRNEKLHNQKWRARRILMGPRKPSWFQKDNMDSFDFDELYYEKPVAYRQEGVSFAEAMQKKYDTTGQEIRERKITESDNETERNHEQNVAIKQLQNELDELVNIAGDIGDSTVNDSGLHNQLNDPRNETDSSGESTEIINDTMTPDGTSEVDSARRSSVAESLDQLVNQAETVISKAVGTIGDSIKEYSNDSSVAPPIPESIETIRDSANGYLSSMISHLQNETQKISNDENVKKTYEIAMKGFLQSASQMFDVLFSNDQTKSLHAFAGTISGQLHDATGQHADVIAADLNKRINTPEDQMEKLMKFEDDEKESKEAWFSFAKPKLVEAEPIENWSEAALDMDETGAAPADLSDSTLPKTAEEEIEDNLVVEENRAFMDKYNVVINELDGQKQTMIEMFQNKDKEDIEKLDENDLPLPTVDLGSEKNFGEAFKPSETYMAIKDKLESEYTGYLSEHTELKPLIKEFVKELLIRKPDSVYKFAATYFTDKYESSQAVKADTNLVTLVIENAIDSEVVHDFPKYELVYEKLWNEARKLGKLTSLVMPLQNRGNFYFGKETKLTYEVGNAYLTYKTANETNDALAYFGEKYEDQEGTSVSLVMIDNP